MAELAKQLDVAEPTLWRWLRGQGLTLVGLSRICDAIGLDFRDLVERSQGPETDRFSLRQERFLAADRELALIFFVVLNGEQRQSLIDEFGLDAVRVDQHIERLRRLGLISVGPRGRLRPLISRTARWRRGGPLAVAFERTVKGFFLSMDFGAEDALYVSDMIRLSDFGRKRVHALFEKLRSDIHMVAEQDAVAGLDRYDWSALFMLVRPLDVAEVTKDLN
ncbi:hypothetical protein MB02_01605 [Croceicoccus estronivorus]|nr:hypothetical protein MB02_01605 [Croceicoccus estronivorus]